MWGNWVFMYCWWKWKIAQLLWESLAIPQKSYTKLLYDSNFMPRCIYSREMKTNVRSSIIYNNQEMETNGHQLMKG